MLESSKIKIYKLPHPTDIYPKNVDRNLKLDDIKGIF